MWGGYCGYLRNLCSLGWYTLVLIANNEMIISIWTQEVDIQSSKGLPVMYEFAVFSTKQYYYPLGTKIIRVTKGMFSCFVL